MRKQNFDSRQHFSIRKLTIGAVSVLIGTSFYMAGGNIAHADTVKPGDVQNAQVQNKQVDSNSDVNKAENNNADAAENKPIANNDEVGKQNVNANKSATTNIDDSANKGSAANTNVVKEAVANKDSADMQSNVVAANKDQETKIASVDAQNADANKAPVSNKSNVEAVSNENNAEANTSSVQNNVQQTVDVHKATDSVATINDARNNVNFTYAVHYKVGNKIVAPDTNITMKFHRDYTIDNATNEKTIGKWQYVAGSMTQSGTLVTNIGEPVDSYNPVDGFDSFNFWFPFSAKIDGRETLENTTSYSGFTASLSIPNSDGYMTDSSLNSDININVGEGNRMEWALRNNMQGVPSSTKFIKFTNNDSDVANQLYNETYDIIYQGNIPDNLKPADIHKVIHYAMKVDKNGNIGYRDNRGYFMVNGWVHDVQSLPAVDVPDIIASDGSIYKPTITFTTKSSIEENPEESGRLDEIPGATNHEIFDATNLMLNYDPGQTARGCYAAKFVVTYNSIPAKLDINFVDSETGKRINSQTYNGNVGQKVDQSILNLPQNYVIVSSDLPSSLAETNTATVKVMKTIKQNEASHEVTKQFYLPIQVIGVFRGDKGDNVPQHRLDNPFLGTNIPIHIQFTYDTSSHKLINYKFDPKWDAFLKSIPLVTSKTASAGYVINDELTKINNKLNVIHLVVNSDTNHPYFAIDEDGKKQAINILNDWLAKQNNGKGWDGKMMTSIPEIPYYVIYDQINNNTFAHTDKLVPKVTSDVYEGSTKINSLDEQSTGLHFGIQLVRHNTLRPIRVHGLDARLHVGDNEQISDLKFVVKTDSSLPNGITITDDGLDPKSTYLGKMTSVDRATDENTLRSLAGDSLIYDNSARNALSSFEKGRTYEIFTVSVNNPYKTLLGNPVYDNGVASPKLVAVDVTNNVISFVSGNYSPEFNLLVGLAPLYATISVEQSRTVTFVDKTDNKTIKTVTQNVNRQQTNEVSRMDGHIINAGDWMVQSVSDPVLINMNDFDNWYTLDHIQTEDGTILENTNEISLPSDLTSDRLDMPNIVVYLNRRYETKDVNVQRILRFDDKTNDQVVLDKSFTFKHFESDPWMTENGDQSVSIDPANVPVVVGYVADKASFDKVSIDHTLNNVKQEITYHRVGRIVPVDTYNKPLANVPALDYVNDPSDPTKVIPQLVPSILGYVALIANVTPVDPTKDTFVVYTAKQPDTATSDSHDLPIPDLDPDKDKQHDIGTSDNPDSPTPDPDNGNQQDTGTSDNHDLPTDPDKGNQPDAGNPDSYDVPVLDQDKDKQHDTDDGKQHDTGIPDSHNLPIPDTETSDNHDLPLDPDKDKQHDNHNLPTDPDKGKQHDTVTPDNHDLPTDPDKGNQHDVGTSDNHDLPTDPDKGNQHDVGTSDVSTDPDKDKQHDAGTPDRHDLPTLDLDNGKQHDAVPPDNHNLPELESDKGNQHDTETSSLPELDPDKEKQHDTGTSNNHELPVLDSDKEKQHDTVTSDSHELPALDPDKGKQHDTGTSNSHELPTLDPDKDKQNDSRNLPALDPDKSRQYDTVTPDSHDLPALDPDKSRQHEFSIITDNTSAAIGSSKMHDSISLDKIPENKTTDRIKVVKVDAKTAKISENISEKSSKHTIQKPNNIQDKKTDNDQLPQTGTKNSNYVVLSGILIGITGLLKLLGSSFKKNKGK